MKILRPLVLLVLLAAPVGAAVETWGDGSLPVKQGLILWLDAAKQNAAQEAMRQPPLADGAAIDVSYDGSGRGNNFRQAASASRPRYLAGDGHPTIRFDGKDDYLSGKCDCGEVNEFTVVLVTSPRSNAGKFRAFLAASALGKNDFETGFNIDQGPQESNAVEGFDAINVEGRAFRGARNLSEGTSPFGPMHAIVVTCGKAGNDAVKLSLNGKLVGKRERSSDAGPMSLERLTLGARYYSLGSTPAVQGFLDGDISEVLMFDRVLSDEEQARLGEYLLKKHPELEDSFARMREAAGKPLVVLENPPAVQMLVPGFVARKLPVDLTNINNLRYRADGKLYALAYNGNVYLLSDSDGDGLEDKAELFWESKGQIEAPIGAAVTPPNYKHGNGLFIACKGKLTLIVDTNGDDKADKEIVVATGWKLTFHPVDAVGVVVAPDQSIYFGLGCWNFADPFMIDKEGKSHYDIASERGTVMKVSPDFSKREVVCTGIRFSVGMALNGEGDLFVTDQEGATWLANGNPFDELLHIQRGRHYGFPPRHPKFLPNVIDEPSTFDYVPQHQSACGLAFNEPVNGGPTFGPSWWRGNALVCGESRGKIYRTQLTKTQQGYVARTQLIGAIPMLTIDSCVSPAGDLVVTCHGGEPDWGTGPTGKGAIYKISYRDKDIPQPVLCWAGPDEVCVAFDRPVDPIALAGAAKNAKVEFGRYVGAGDRFEKMRPGYAAVKRQQNSPRQNLPITGVQLTRDQRTLILKTARQSEAMSYALTLPTTRPAPAGDEIAQLPATDLAYDLTGVAADWRSADGKQSWNGWLPHPDLSVARAMTAGSAQHDELWKLLRTPGELTLRTSLDLLDMLRPALQPGSRLDYTLPPEQVTVSLKSNLPLKLNDSANATLAASPQVGQWTPVEIKLTTDSREPALNVSFVTNEDARPRPLPLRRFFLPWAKPKTTGDESEIVAAPPPQLKGGDWLRGRAIFFGSEAACSRCHTVRGQGGDIGPDLSNLIHRDYDSVLRDIRQPSAALNPDHLASIVKMKDGRVLCGIVRKLDEKHFMVRGDAEGEKQPLAYAAVKRTYPSPISVMPTGILEGLGEAKTHDLLTFLLTQPLEPAPIERKGPPPPRARAELDSVLAGAGSSTPQPTTKPLSILLVSGTKDHGPSEHDYPAFQKRWSTLLSLADHVKVEQATDWPTPAQWEANQVVVFYCANSAWAGDKARDLDAHLAKGRGLIFQHMAVHGHDAPRELAERIGLAWGPGAKFRHGPVELTFRDTTHPIARNFDKVKFIDESYWNLTGDVSKIHVLADAPEEDAPRPILWTRQTESGGRVFVSLLGHYTWTLDDPLYRVLLLRSLAWTAHEPPERLLGLATIGARVSP